jgi:AraC family transcriptional regulator
LSLEPRRIGIGSVLRSEAASVTVHAELSVPAATAQIVRFELAEPADSVIREEDSYRLDLCLTPRMANARGCFRESWGPHRFEPVGDLFLLPAGQDLHMRSDGGGQSSMICQLHRDPILDWVGGKIEWNDRRLEAILDISNTQIRTLLLRLAHETRHPGFASQLLVELIAGQLAIELGRYCQSVADTPMTGGLASWRIRLIDERLMEVTKAPTLTELAALCNLSVRQLTRGFRASRGCSIGDYVAQSRIKTAKRLLVGSESVKAIAYAMGFSSPSSFSFAFRRATGLTPGQFRQHIRRAAH